jgi:olfactory receptor
MMKFAAVLLGVGPLTGILFYYSKVVSSAHKISSTQGKYKAFSIWVSHLSVSPFFSTLLGVYLSAAGTQNSHSCSTASVIYTVVTLMLNPFFYNLRKRTSKVLWKH